MKKPIATPSRTKEILETHGMFAKKKNQSQPHLGLKKFLKRMECSLKRTMVKIS